MASMKDPIHISGLTLKNRLVKSATAEHMSDERGFISEQYLRFYHKLARGGVSLIITGHIFVSKEGRTSIGSPVLDEDSKIERFQEVTEEVHRSGCKIFAQLNHGGREALLSLAPSRVRNSLTWVKPREMSGREILAIIEQFRESARRAKQAGFDGIQIHGAHGYLVNQFLSRRMNRRNDYWGGRKIDNRMRFLWHLYEGMREAVGEDFPIILKINGSDHIKNGLEVPEVHYILKKLEESGLNAVEISGSTIETGFLTIRGAIPFQEILKGRSLYKKAYGYQKLKRLARKAHLVEGYNLKEAVQIKKELKIPVICVGGIRSRAFIEEILRENYVDMVALARPLIREPALPRKFLQGTKDRADCISCNQCFAARGPLKCRQRINPENGSYRI